MQDDEIIETVVLRKRFGGAQVGTGPKPQRDQPTVAQVKREFFTGERLGELLNMLWAMAKNEPVLTTVFDDVGKAHKVKRPPYSARVQLAATQDLADRAFGKAVQAVEMSGPNGGAIQTINIFQAIDTAALTSLIDELESGTTIDAETASDDRGGTESGWASDVQPLRLREASSKATSDMD